jgi:hypothetical protein
MERNRNIFAWEVGFWAISLLPPALRVLTAVIARSEATKQSILSLRCEMDCFAVARNDVLGRN